MKKLLCQKAVTDEIADDVLFMAVDLGCFGNKPGPVSGDGHAQRVSARVLWPYAVAVVRHLSCDAFRDETEEENERVHVSVFWLFGDMIGFCLWR